MSFAASRYNVGVWRQRFVTKFNGTIPLCGSQLEIIFLIGTLIHD